MAARIGQSAAASAAQQERPNPILDAALEKFQSEIMPLKQELVKLGQKVGAEINESMSFSMLHTIVRDAIEDPQSNGENLALSMSYLGKASTGRQYSDEEKAGYEWIENVKAGLRELGEIEKRANVTLDAAFSRLMKYILDGTELAAAEIATIGEGIPNDKILERFRETMARVTKLDERRLALRLIDDFPGLDNLSDAKRTANDIYDSFVTGKDVDFWMEQLDGIISRARASAGR